MKINWRYTIGEILIVIIGITIAFSLNNWKEKRASNKLKKQYLANLASDIKQEIKQLNELELQVKKRLQQIKTVKPHLGHDQPQRDTIIKTVFELARLINFYPETTTYQTLISSGDMKLIDNFHLRRNLEEHYALHKLVLLDFERIEKIHEKYLGNYFIYQIDFKEVFNGNTQFLDDPLLRNIITSIEGSCFLVTNNLRKCLKSNESLLDEIEQELKLLG